MDKESAYDLQRLDCNCNDCGRLVRNLARTNTVYAEDFDSQVTFFRAKKARRIISARERVRKDPERGAVALQQALALEFHYFPQRKPISYGHCTLFNHAVSFIPGTLQLNTQSCFVHRKDLSLQESNETARK